MADVARGEPGPWRRFGERVAFDAPEVGLTEVDVGLPTQERVWLPVVRLIRSVAVALLDDRGRVLVVWRYRFVAQRWGWELPGGQVDADEDPADAATRELDELTGYRAGRLERLVAFEPAADVVDGERVVFLLTVAKAYRLLHAIFTTAVEEDRIVRRNPCRIMGASKEDSMEREVISLPTVFAIADAVPPRYRALVLLATFADLRWGELAGLRRENLDLETCEVRVVETVAELDAGGLLPETPKSRAGQRTVAFPAELVPELRWHMERFAEPGPRGAVFVGPQGGRLRRSNFYAIREAPCRPPLARASRS